MSLEARLGEENLAALDTTGRASIQLLVDNAVWIPTPGRLLGYNFIGGGIDLCYVPDMEEVMRDSPRAIERIFVPSEIAFAMIQPRPAENLAARYATKEAGFKAGGFNYRDLVVVRQADGKPVIVLEGQARQRAARLGVEVHLAGLSHTHDMAVAWVALLRRMPDEDINRF